MDQVKLPEKIDIQRLRHHFKTMYMLDDEKIDTMLESSVKSLSSTIEKIYIAIDDNEDLEKIAKLAHSIKGLFLNMGEESWAEIAREFEVSAMAGAAKDYRKYADKICYGVADLL